MFSTGFPQPCGKRFGWVLQPLNTWLIELSGVIVVWYIYYARFNGFLGWRRSLAPSLVLFCAAEPVFLELVEQRAVANFKNTSRMGSVAVSLGESASDQIDLESGGLLFNREV